MHTCACQCKPLQAPKQTADFSRHFLSAANRSMLCNVLLFCCRERLAELPRRFAWYPGSDKRSAAFKAKFRDAEELGTAVEGGETSAGFLPWTFKSGLTPDQVGTASAVAGTQLKPMPFCGVWIKCATV